MMSMISTVHSTAAVSKLPSTIPYITVLEYWDEVEDMSEDEIFEDHVHLNPEGTTAQVTITNKLAAHISELNVTLQTPETQTEPTKTARTQKPWGRDDDTTRYVRIPKEVVGLLLIGARKTKKERLGKNTGSESI